MRRTLTWKLGTIILAVILITSIISSITTYITAYERLYESAGMEAYGCANITTGLLDTEDINHLMNGNHSEVIGEKINWTVDHKEIFENHYILSLDGEILALDDNLRKQGFNVGDNFYIDKEAIQELIEQRHSTYSEIYEFGDMERISGYAPIYKNHDPSQDIVAISAIDFNADIVSDRTWAVVKDGFMLGIIPLIFAGLITFYLIRKKTKPISTLIEKTKLIAEKEISETKLDITSNDEVGDLAKHLEIMSGNLREIISTIKGASEALHRDVNDTSTSMDEMSIALSQVSKNMEEVASGTTEGADMTTKVSQELTDLATTIQNAKKKADTSVINAEHTMGTAHIGIEKVHDIKDKMNSIKGSTLETQHMIATLSNYTNEIQHITEAITNIAEQTNLLALNASIEAARAGEHGKGFAVVANEIRKLAEQSNKEALDVAKHTNQITTSIQETAGRIEETRNNVEIGEKTVQETGEALQNIQSAVRNIVKEIKDVSNFTNEEAKTSDHIVQLINRLEEENEKIAVNAQEVSASTEESSAAIEQVSASTETIKELSNKLNSIVNQFKL